MDVSDNTQITGSLEVSGITNLKNRLNVSKDLIVDKAVVSNNLDVSNNTNIAGSLDVSGITNLKDRVKMSKDLLVYKAVVSNNLDVSNNTNIAGSLDVSGITNLNNDVNILEDLFVKNTVISNNLDVYNNTNIAGSLDVSGITSLNNDVNISSDLKVIGNGRFTGLVYASTLNNGFSLTLPTADGTSGQLLQTNGSGTLSFTTPSLNDLTDVFVDEAILAGTIVIGENFSPSYDYSIHNTSLGIDTFAKNNGLVRYNTSIGYKSLSNLTDNGSNGNTAIGSESNSNATSCKMCTSVGYHSMIYNYNNGFGNTSVGTFAMSGNTVHGLGQYNTAIGYSALNANFGDYNIAIGYYAGFQAGQVNYSTNLINGDNNLIIGSGPVSNPTTLSEFSGYNQIVIGNGAKGKGNNYAVIGNSDIERVYMAEDGAAEIYANGTINTSDKRLKEDIQTTKLGLDFINKLNPVSYKWNNKPNDKRDHEGLIAQEVENVIKEFGLTKDNHALVNYEESDDKYRLAYTELIPPLVKSIQEQDEKIKQLESENDLLKSQMSQILERLNKLENK